MSHLISCLTVGHTFISVCHCQLFHSALVRSSRSTDIFEYFYSDRYSGSGFGSAVSATPKSKKKAELAAKNAIWEAILSSLLEGLSMMDTPLYIYHKILVALSGVSHKVRYHVVTLTILILVPATSQ